MDSKRRFSNRVNNYVKYRPGYPHEAIRYLFGTVGLSGESVIADVGSGTGIFTSLIADKVTAVYAVEPNDNMRAAAEKSLGGIKGFISVAASAEATTLPEKSVDFITTAQAFHWFDMDACRREFRRVLKPHGRVVLIWNERLTGAGFQQDYEDLLKERAKNYDGVRHKNLERKDFERFFLNGAFEAGDFSNSQDFDFSALLGRALSSSFVPVEGEGGYDEFVKGLEDIFEKHNVNGRVEFKYNTRVVWGEV